MHGLVKVVNGHDILHWSLGGVYYITDKKNYRIWVCENKDLKVVEEYARSH